MQMAFFLFFAVAAILAALSLILQKNPIYSALSLIVVIASMGGLFLLLNANFIAVLQLVIYAGAIMTLFLFVIMMVEARDEFRPVWNIQSRVILLVLFVIAGITIWAVSFSDAQIVPLTKDFSVKGIGALSVYRLRFSVRSDFDFNHLLCHRRALHCTKGGSMIPPAYYIILSLLLFLIGVLGILIRRNLLVLFMCIELMLNSVNLALITFSRVFQNLDGQILAFFVITVAAAEATIGLAIILLVYRSRKVVEIDELNSMRG